MLMVQVGIIVSDPDGPPPGGSGILIQESSQVGLYLPTLGDPAANVKLFTEDIGIAIAEQSRRATDLALEAAAKLAKEATEQNGQ